MKKTISQMQPLKRKILITKSFSLALNQSIKVLSKETWIILKLKYYQLNLLDSHNNNLQLYQLSRSHQLLRNKSTKGLFVNRQTLDLQTEYHSIQKKCTIKLLLYARKHQFGHKKVIIQLTFSYLNQKVHLEKQ